MKLLVIGAGGREHALAWKLNQSSRLDALYVAPGNAGTASFATNLPVSVEDFPAIARMVHQHRIDLVVVGPEVPLVKGISDFFQNDPALSHVGVVGPNREAAQLEGSKEFAKAFMDRHGIPTAAYQSFGPEELQQGYAFL